MACWRKMADSKRCWYRTHRQCRMQNCRDCWSCGELPRSVQTCPMPASILDNTKLTQKVCHCCAHLLQSGCMSLTTVSSASYSCPGLGQTAQETRAALLNTKLCTPDAKHCGSLQHDRFEVNTDHSWRCWTAHLALMKRAV